MTNFITCARNRCRENEWIMVTKKVRREEDHRRPESSQVSKSHRSSVWWRVYPLLYTHCGSSLPCTVCELRVKSNAVSLGKSSLMLMRCGGWALSILRRKRELYTKSRAFRLVRRTTMGPSLFVPGFGLSMCTVEISFHLIAMFSFVSQRSRTAFSAARDVVAVDDVEWSTDAAASPNNSTVKPEITRLSRRLYVSRLTVLELAFFRSSLNWAFSTL